MNKRKIGIPCVMFIMCMYILVFQNWIQEIIKPIQYFDEILALLVIPIGFIKFSLKKQRRFVIKKDNLIIIGSLLILAFLGLLSNIIYKYQPINIYLSDMLLVFKFFLVFLLSSWIWKDKLIENKNTILFNLKIIIANLFILSICNYVFNIWPWEIRFGIRTNKLFYTQPTILASVCVFLLSLLYYLSENNNKIELFQICLILLSTLRLKAIGAVIIILLVVLYVFKTERKLSITKFGILGFILLILAWDQINYYYVELDGSARNQLTIRSFQIAKDYFPLGTGFATYASHFSGVNYSPIYAKYKLNKVYGLVKGHTEFISDTFWPMIIGQFGFIGTLSYSIVLFLFFKKIQNTFKKDNLNVYVSKIICFLYLLISSTSEAAFVHSFAIPLAIILAL